MKMVVTVNKALWEDCEAGNLEEVRRALETGADPNSYDESYDGSRGSMTCLMIAAEENHAEVVSLLLDQPTIDVNMVGDHNGTALHFACVRNSEAALRRLLTAPGLEMNGFYEWGYTPIMFACMHGALECVRLLSAVAEVDLDRKCLDYPKYTMHLTLEER